MLWHRRLSASRTPLLSLASLLGAAGLYLFHRRTGRTQLTASLLAGDGLLISVSTVFILGTPDSVLIYALIAILLTGIFFKPRAVVLMTVVFLVVSTALSLTEPTGLQYQFQVTIAAILFICVAVVVMLQHLSSLENIRRRELKIPNERLRESEASLEKRVSERTRELSTAADVSRQITQLLDLKQLLPELTELTRVNFGLLRVSVFLAEAMQPILRL